MSLLSLSLSLSLLALDRIVGTDHPRPPALQRRSRLVFIKVERRHGRAFVDVDQEVELLCDLRRKVVRVALRARDLLCTE